MKEEVSPTIITIILCVIGAVLLGIVYFAFFRQGPAPDITKVQGKPPPGWKMPTGRQGAPGAPAAQSGGNQGSGR